ncbi:multidrug efflux pump subunit AcrB [Anseongella ginsenosidimutans]|uniref:Multidrug efflux pump subunit AcrB n=1 Tax=Anseongella ginsenosidimutans TaxID=496056 RepID=A0A4R3KPK6_9SPHI|nr:efflux RND transporter permease subunit [Anseongella ginsenosidimutans]QEC53640.1 efflux RND transporter permease subunit [Anseongella ginsenosidimutans]TCS86112.1 multidrug efflux pump subunit AcrB [Anseongella ginsenosidimutans]
MKDIFKEFKGSSWAIENRTSVYIATVIICLAGLFTYIGLPKEQFPEVVFPQIYVSTVYPGTGPADMENLVTKPIEKQVKSIKDVEKVTSNSLQDFSNIIIEFDTDVDVEVAKQRVKDAVDKAKPDLPTDLPDDPEVIDIDISQLPIMNINLSGSYDLVRLKEYAEDMQDRIETLPEITRVDIVGALEREIQVNVDLYKMQSAKVSFSDIEQAIASENVTVSGGQVSVDGMKRSLSVNGEYKDAEKMENIIVTSTSGAQVYLKDIAEVVDDHEEQESYARLDGENVITLNVIKRSGENLINASDKINVIVDDMMKNDFPPGLKTTITADQSDNTRVTLHDLINTIIIGFVLVTIILMFFMGTTNAIFVALAVPLSSFLAFLIMPGLDSILPTSFTLNMMVLFSFLLALGIVVDDAIVVVENTHRIYDNGKMEIKKAAKAAAGEVFLPVLSGTIVTLAPFIPLLFWPGVIGKFMFFLPATLIIALLASLVVAYIMNPVFAVDFMKPHNEDRDHHKKITRGFKITALVMGILALIFYLAGSFGMGNFIVFLFGIYALNKFVLTGLIRRFQEKTWPRVQEGYKKLISWCLHKSRPAWVLVGTFLLFIFSIVFTALRQPPVGFFPQGDPNFIYTYIELPIGTHQEYTDSITHIVENRIARVMEEDSALVESIISNVAIGASDDPMAGGFETSPHLGKVTVAFVKFAERDGRSTKVYLEQIRNAVQGIPGAEITVDQEQAGPPTGKPISIEISGEDFEVLIDAAENVQEYLVEQRIGGIEELKSDFQSNKPEIAVNIDRERARREGISTAQIGLALRNALYGKEVSKFRDENDDYPIMVRLEEDQRNNVNTLVNMPITFRDANSGQVRQIPLSSVATIEYTSTYARVTRIDQKRVITLSSNVLTGYNANAVVAEIQQALGNYQAPEGIDIRMTGEQEDQAETMGFLQVAFLVSFGLIFMVLVTQFNSLSKPLIIMAEIFFSIIGVLIGFSLFKMEISIVMTGVGLFALAGIVVRNGILLVEFTDLLIEQGVETREAIIEAGKTRMTPVILTALAATMGLIPLAVGFNIDFVKMFTELNPHIFFGGDNVVFWGPLSWTMIFGLIFGTFITLILVPVLYYLVYRIKVKTKKKIQKLQIS